MKQWGPVQGICLFVLRPMPCPCCSYYRANTCSGCFSGSLANWFPDRFGQWEENSVQQEGRGQGMSSAVLCFRMSAWQWLSLLPGSRHSPVPAAWAPLSAGALAPGPWKACHPFVPLTHCEVRATFSSFFPLFLPSSLFSFSFLPFNQSINQIP